MDIDADVAELLATVTHKIRRRDADTLLELFGRVTGEEPRLWYKTIIGYGEYHYRYESGREGDAGAAGFSPRKAATSIYLPDGIGAHTELLAKLGPHTSGVGCLYLKNLDQNDLTVLEQIIATSYRTVSSGIYGLRARDGGVGSGADSDE
ncbi:DUF1801 domain-containing protein [Plantibacter sp. Mn2098]|uniref:DUF1801 domain-containing protein n=1 Tax=Plantibacter sp. Mn2098 TaxID=3395266 RepID=UPI003BC732A0